MDPRKPSPDRPPKEPKTIRRPRELPHKRKTTDPDHSITRYPAGGGYRIVRQPGLLERED